MKPESVNNTYQGLLGLDKLQKELKTVNWVVCFIIATCIALLNYSRIADVLPQIPLRLYLSWLAWTSPTCLAVVWLRLTGVKWQQALLLFIFVPLGVIGINLIISLLISLSY